MLPPAAPVPRRLWLRRKRWFAPRLLKKQGLTLPSSCQPGPGLQVPEHRRGRRPGSRLIDGRCDAASGSACAAQAMAAPEALVCLPAPEGIAINVVIQLPTGPGLQVPEHRRGRRPHRTGAVTLHDRKAHRPNNLRPKSGSPSIKAGECPIAEFHRTRVPAKYP